MCFLPKLEHYSFPSLDLRNPNLFQHDEAPEHRVTSMKTPWIAKAGAEELDPTEQLGDQLELHLYPRPPHPTSGSDLTKAPVAE